MPRANSADAITLDALWRSPLEEIARLDVDLKHALFHPSFDERVETSRLLSWRDDLDSWASDMGYPNKMSERRRAAWDVALGERLLTDTAELSEAEDPTVWCWLATHLLPHLVVYRWGWPAGSPETGPTGRDPWTRFGPTDKNGLLLARQRVAIYGRELALHASEQEFQSIQYRPAFGLDRRVARVILEILVEAAQDMSSNYGRQGSTRSDDADDVCVELRIINSMRPFCFLSDDAIAEIVRETIERLPEIRDPRKEARRNRDKSIQGQQSAIPA